MKKQNKNINTQVILHLEDSPEDAELIADLIGRANLHFDINLVSDRMDFTEAINVIKPDLILSDFDLPGFDGFEAFKIAKEYAPDTPFIFVTGAVGEEMAVTALKAGATDFILKNNLARLVPALNRALEEKKISAERKQLYHNLIEGEERYRTLLENLPIGVFRISLLQQGKVIQANMAAAEMYGYDSIEELLDAPTEDLYQKQEEREEFRSNILEYKKIKNQLIQLKKASGEPFWASISASCHFDNTGNPDWIDGVVEDVTERLEIENELSGYVKFFETLLDTISSPVFYKDNERRYIGCNRSFAERIFGLPREQIINKTVFDLKDFIPDDLAVKYDNTDRELLSNPGVQEYDARVKEADGMIRFYHFSKSTYPGTDGKVAGLVGIMMDITERVENERELKRINEELDLLITSLSSIIIGVSVKDRVTHWNPFAEKVFGINAEDIIGRKFVETGIKWSWELIYEAISNSILEEKSIRLHDLKFENREGKSGILGLTINPLKRGGEILDGFIILGKDLTEQRILETQLLQSNKLEAIGQLSAGVAHEINTPMQYVGDNLKFINKSFVGIIGMLDLYEKACNSIDNKTEFTDIIKQSEELSKKIKLPYLLEQMPRALEQSLEGVKRVSGIVQSMKAFSHPGSGEKMPADINKAIENTVTVSRNEWKYDCDLKLELDPDLPDVPCYESEFNQVILNLLVNARDAIREAKEANKIETGQIIVSTTYDNRSVIIKVKDNGGGIPEKIKNRIFDPFFTTKDVGKGTGQGLAISHSIIVEKHSGSLYFESEAGEGTTFIIKLPLAEKEYK